MTAAVLTAAVISLSVASEQTRRFPVELEVLAANAGKLLDTTLPERYRQGLQLRMAGSLGTMQFLAREYLQATHQPANNLHMRIDRLALAFRRHDWQTLAHLSRRLARDYPVVLTGLRPDDAGPQALAAGKHIYRHLCMGCHEHPDRSQAVPAPDLFAMARTEPVRELIARLIAGVHGTPAVALRNPFSDKEIAGLAAYLKTAQTPGR